MKVLVKQEHCRHGRVDSIRRCPVALALQDCIKHNAIVSVYDNEVFIYYNENWGSGIWVKLNEETHNKINEFDRTGIFYPCELEINIPENFVKEEVYAG